MAVSKVIYGDQTVMDITDSDVTPDNLLLGNTGYDSAGNKVTGKVGVKVENGKLILHGNLYSVQNGKIVIGNSVSDGLLNLSQI